MSREQVVAIKEKFNRIDKDFDGFLDIEEVKEYYNQIMKQKVESFRRIADLFIENDPDKKTKFENDFERRSQMAKLCCAKSVEHFMKRDINNDGKIEWNEFLNFEARLISQAQLIKV